MAETKIEWATHVWNPVVGCEAVSPGCAHCYAATMTRRLEAMGQQDYAGLTTAKHFNGTIRCLPHKLDIPLKRRKPTMYFVNSMSDLFHDDVPDEFIDRVFAVMALCHWHTFVVLTKRAQRMYRYLVHEGRRAAIDTSGTVRISRNETHICGHTCFGWPLPNVWLGVSVEDQQRADERVPWLLKTPAAVRFLSCEPLLGQIRFDRMSIALSRNSFVEGSMLGTRDHEQMPTFDPRRPSGCGIDWVIVGGESGPGARPMHPDWARSLRDQCQAAGVPFFFKHWGEWAPQPKCDDCTCIPGELCCDRRGKILDDGSIMVRVGKKHAGRLLDGREWNEFPAAAKEVAHA